MGLQNDAHCGWIVSPVRSGEARHGLVMTDGAFVGDLDSADAFDGSFDGNGALDGALDGAGALDGLELDVGAMTRTTAWDSITNAQITNAPSTRWRHRTITKIPYTVSWYECELAGRKQRKIAYEPRTSSALSEQ